LENKYVFLNPTAMGKQAESTGGAELQRFHIKFVYLFQGTYCLISTFNRAPEAEVDFSPHVYRESLTAVFLHLLYILLQRVGRRAVVSKGLHREVSYKFFGPDI
jgi:hypothetical protein